MEGLNKIGGMNQQITNDKIINIRASEIMKIFGSPENRHAFAIENSKFALYNIDLFFPKLVGFDATFMLQVLSGEKKVIRYLTIIVLTIESFT